MVNGHFTEKREIRWKNDWTSARGMAFRTAPFEVSRLIDRINVVHG